MKGTYASWSRSKARLRLVSESLPQSVFPRLESPGCGFCSRRAHEFEGRVRRSFRQCGSEWPRDSCSALWNAERCPNEGGMQASETPPHEGGFLAPDPAQIRSLAAWLSLVTAFEELKANDFRNFAVCYQNIANRAKEFQPGRFLVAVPLEPGC